MCRFVLNHATSGWYWQLRDGGDRLAQSGPWASELKARQSIKSFKATAPDAPIEVR